MAYISSQKDKIYNPYQTGQVGVGGIQKNPGAGDAGGSGGSQTKAPGDFTQSQNLQGASVAAINRNKGAGEAVGKALLQPGQKQLQRTLFGLGQEQDAFKQAGEKQIKEQTPVFNTADLSKVGSDSETFYKAKDALGKQFNPVQSYQTQLNTNIANPTLTGNYASILQGQKGPSYTKGMSLLDQTLFSRAPGRQGQLANQYVGMQDQANTKLGEGTKITEDINKRGAESVKSAQDKLRSEIASSKQSQLQKDKESATSRKQADQAAYEKALSDMLRSNPYNTMGAPVGDSISSQMLPGIDRIKSVSPDVDLTSKYVDQLLGLGADRYINRGSGVDSINPTADTIRSQESANQLNALNALLGLDQNEFQAGNYQSPVMPSFNTSAYETDLNNIISAAGKEQSARSDKKLSDDIKKMTRTIGPSVTGAMSRGI